MHPQPIHEVFTVRRSDGHLLLSRIRCVIVLDFEILEVFLSAYAAWDSVLCATSMDFSAIRAFGLAGGTRSQISDDG